MQRRWISSAALLVALGLAGETFAERRFEERSEATHVILGTVAGVYVREKEDTRYYLVEITIETVEKGEGFKPGGTFYVGCYLWTPDYHKGREAAIPRGDRRPRRCATQPLAEPRVVGVERLGPCGAARRSGILAGRTGVDSVPRLVVLPLQLRDRAECAGGPRPDRRGVGVARRAGSLRPGTLRALTRRVHRPHALAGLEGAGRANHPLG